MTALTLQTRKYERDSAALSIAANRLSKVRLLLDDDTPRCNAIALRFAQSLSADIEDHLRRYPQTAERFACELRYVAAMAMDEAEEANDIA